MRKFCGLAAVEAGKRVGDHPIAFTTVSSRRISRTLRWLPSRTLISCWHSLLKSHSAFGTERSTTSKFDAIDDRWGFNDLPTCHCVGLHEGSDSSCACNAVDPISSSDSRPWLNSHFQKASMDRLILHSTGASRSPSSFLDDSRDCIDRAPFDFT